MVVMKIAPDTQVRKGHFVGTKYFARTADSVVLGMVEIVVVGNVNANLWREELRIKSRFFRPRIAVQPGPVCKSKWLRLRRLSGRSACFTLFDVRTRRHRDGDRARGNASRQLGGMSAI